MFLDESDHYRGIFSLFEFNNKNPITIRQRRQQRIYRGPTPVNSRERLVELVAFCFMPNHVHLLLTPVTDKGVSLFIRKFASGYPAYFKNKYDIKRKGYFFQDKFHSVHIKNDAQLRAVFVYIHLNPVSLIFPGWKEGEKMRSREAFKYCADYRWSSLKDYMDKKNFPSVTDREFMSKFMGGAKGCEAEIKNWLKHKEEMLDKHEEILIE